MAHRVVLRPAALDDLAAIEEWIAERSDHETATAYGDRILDACDALGNFPRRGSDRDDLIPGARTVSFERSATIVYVVQDDIVEVARILRKGRDIVGALAND